MKHFSVFLFIVGVFSIANGFGIADMISNYAKVSVNSHTNSTSMATTTPDSPNNSTIDDIEEDYNDFDDDEDTTPERSVQSSSDTNTMLKYLNGVVNLLALMYQFSGKPLKPQSVHFGKMKTAGQTGRNSLAESVNSIAEDRYQPSTAYKKFKQNSLKQMNTNPYSQSKAESYSSGGGATSYDADAMQYMIKNPDKDTSNDDGMKLSYGAPPMKDYMSQNDPVQIQQSYSYEIPNVPKKTKMPELSAMNYGTNYEDVNADGGDGHNSGPVYYPWMAKPTKAPYPMGEMNSNDESPPSDGDMKHIKSPVYYPWMTKPSEMEKPLNIKGPGPDHDPHVDPALYYPWTNSPPKKSKIPKPPPPPVDPTDEYDNDHDDSPPQWMPEPTKGKPTDMGGKMKYAPPDDAPPYYYHFPEEGDHGLIDDQDDHHHDHHDHDMKDEDRESKRPYTYYHLGRKLWYIPLLFSLYFIVYIGSLILKSIARHKVQFPEKLWEIHDQHHEHDEHGRRGRQIDEVTQRVYESIENVKNKFM